MPLLEHIRCLPLVLYVSMPPYIQVGLEQVLDFALLLLRLLHLIVFLLRHANSRKIVLLLDIKHEGSLQIFIRLDIELLRRHCIHDCLQTLHIVNKLPRRLLL